MASAPPIPLRPPGPARPRGASGVLLAAAALLLLFTGLSLWEMSGDSLTTDERWHLPAGLAHWKAREFRLSPEHPPLARLLAAAPLLAMGLRLPPLAPPPGTTWHDYPPHFGTAFFDLNPETDRIMLRSRLPILALGVLLLATIFWWSRALWDSAGAGLLALGLAALEPTLIAHSHYVTTDVAVAAFGLLAFAALWSFSRDGRAAALSLAVAAMGLALAAKFSAVFLLPVFLFLLWRRWPAGAHAASAHPPSAHPAGFASAAPLAVAGARPAGRAALLLAALLAMGAIVQAAYFFSPDLTLYARGLFAVPTFKPAHYPAYVHGAFFIGGVWWYSPYAWLLKTPLPTLAAIAIGLALCRRDAGRATPGLAFVLLPAAVYAVAVCLLSANLGARYLIPTTAFMLVAAGRTFAWLAATRRRRLAASALAAWLLASVLHAAPHFIAYFNELIGGPANAPYVLHDSNVDWGQDLKRLARHLEARGAGDPVIAYWGGARPEYYGIRWRRLTPEMARADPPPPGLYALSVNHLVDLKKRVALAGADPNLDWLRRFRPTARVGYSIWIYEFPAARGGP